MRTDNRLNGHRIVSSPAKVKFCWEMLEQGFLLFLWMSSLAASGRVMHWPTMLVSDANRQRLEREPDPAHRVLRKQAFAGKYWSRTFCTSLWMPLRTTHESASCIGPPTVVLSVMRTDNEVKGNRPPQQRMNDWLTDWHSGASRGPGWRTQTVMTNGYRQNAAFRWAILTAEIAVNHFGFRSFVQISVESLQRSPKPRSWWGVVAALPQNTSPPRPS